MSVGAERFETMIIGGGQAGLAVGYYLAKQRRRFVILDASERIGDSWRNRWDSLRLFTPSRYNGLPGMRSPGLPGPFRPVTRWRTTSRPMPPASSFPCAAVST